MYDRKTWIVIVACSVLLAVNLYFSQKNAAEKRAQELANQPAPSESTGEQAATGETDTPGVLREMGPETEPEEAKEFKLETEGAVFTLTTRGGGVKSAELKGQETPAHDGSYVTLNQSGSSPVGALAEGADRMETVNYKHLEEESVPGESVVFIGRHPSGMIVKKTWAKLAGEEPGDDFLLSLKVDLENPAGSGSRQPLDNFSLFLGRTEQLLENELTKPGVFWLEDGDFELLTAARGGKLKEGFFGGSEGAVIKSSGSVGYVGVSNQFFATALRPDETAGGGFWGKAMDLNGADGDKKLTGARAGYVLPGEVLEPGSRRTLGYRLFMGPKDNRMLRQMGDDWGEIMNYGWFSIFSRFMNFLLVHIHDWVAKISGPWSWGWAIILVTLLVRTMMWPLYTKQNRTMKRMSKLKPEMDKLKEKYPDDPAKVQQETMGLYRKFGINPLGGCLPMLVQIPIFFGFYKMLQSAVELRNEGFLWVDDLSQPDTVWEIPFFGGLPLNVLPILMGLSSFAQIAMMPNTSGDKTQQTIMKLMPLMFFFFCYNFASALALYWTTSNLFSIAQTWITKKLPDPELKERKGGSGKSFMERMAEAAEQQQKMKQARGRVVEEEAKPKKKRGPRTGG